MSPRLARVLAPLGLAALAACSGARDAAPRPGEVVTVAARGATTPTVAVDERGGGYVAWVGREDGVANVLLARVDAGGAPAAPVRVNDEPGDAAPHEQAPAQVRVGPEGNVYVVWQNNTKIAGRRFPASDLRLAVSTDGGRSFRPAIFVNDDAGGPPSSHTFHDIAVAPDGSVYVSWIDSRVRDALRGAQPEGHAGGSHGMGAMQGGHAGHGDDDLPGPEIRVARSTDGGRTFGPAVVVDDASCPCCRTSLAIGPDGSAYVAWRKVFPGDVRDVVVARAAPGTLDFAPPVRVHEDGWVFPGCPHAGPSLSVDAAGGVHVAWYTGRDGRQGLWYAVSHDAGRSFGAPAPLVTAESVPPSQVRLASAAGWSLAAWDDRRGEHPGLVLAAGRAGAPAPLLPVPDAGRDPALAAGRGGALAAWLEGDAIRARWIQGVAPRADATTRTALAAR